MAFLDFDGLKIYTQEIIKYMSEHFPKGIVDSSLSTVSTNPVENQVITNELLILENKMDKFEDYLINGEVTQFLTTDDNVQLVTDDGNNLLVWWKVNMT
jgi:hypothetical protein